MSGGFGTPSARAVREKQSGSACVDHIVAIAHSSIAALWSTMRSMSMLAYWASLQCSSLLVQAAPVIELVRVMSVVMAVGR